VSVEAQGRENPCHKEGKILKRNFGGHYMIYIFQWLKVRAYSEV
jgi:hypothetical protein